MGNGKGKFHYSVLYTPVVKQERLRAVLKEALPEGRGTVFYPCMECWRRDSSQCEIKALFPGYVFIHSDMDRVELHKFVLRHRSELNAYTRELGLNEMRLSNEDLLIEGGKDDRENDKYRLTELTEEEAEFLDFLLDRDGQGLLTMSYGYREGKRYVVMEGPLKAYENRIAHVNRHERKAFLDFHVNGYVVRAGFEVKPKRCWFPEDKNAPQVLADGTEVDLQSLKNKMMGG